MFTERAAVRFEPADQTKMSPKPGRLTMTIRNSIKVGRPPEIGRVTRPRDESDFNLRRGFHN